MTQPAEQHFTYPMFGFWVEIPDSGAHADIYVLPDHDADRGLEGRPHEFPRKRLTGKRNHPETLLAARIWCAWARDHIKTGEEIAWDGDGETPLVDPVAVAAAEATQAASATLASQKGINDPDPFGGPPADLSGAQVALEGTVDKDGKIKATGVSLVKESATEAKPVDPPATPKKPRRQTKA